jgi:hypothetical protein
LALDGDSAALRLVMERLCPARKERPVTVTLPNAIKTPEDVSKAMDKVTKAAAGGELTPSEARTLTGLLESRLKVIETQEIVARLEALERAIKR